MDKQKDVTAVEATKQIMDERQAAASAVAAKQITENLMKVICSHCLHEFPLSSVDERPCDVDGHAKVKEHGFSCPSCGEWSHAYFTGPKTRRHQATLNTKRSLFEKKRTQGAYKQWRRAKARYQKEFDAFQELIRPLVGAQSPAKIAEASRNVPGS